MRYKKIFAKVFEEITPSPKERKIILKEVNTFLSKLNSALKRLRIPAKAVLGGSYAKDTWLSGDHDVDVFVCFDLKYRDENLSDMLQRALKSFKFQRVHGSRDYFWVFQKGIKYEIVPVLAIKKAQDAQNITDFSPRHVNWVNKNGKNLKADIRLVKKFCKAANCYGAESYIRGFSGHVVDILTIHYRGFLPLLKAARNWKPKTVLDCYNVYKSKALLILNKSKIEGPLVLIDPVQPGRNAAAALTLENYQKFVSAAKAFLRQPSNSFFVEKKVDFEKLKKKGVLTVVKVISLKGVEDVAGTKLLKAFEFVRDVLSDFGIKQAGWSWDKKKTGFFWFVLKTPRLQKTFVWEGPPLVIKQHVEKFKKKHKRTFVRKKKIYAYVKRKYLTPEDAVRYALAKRYVRERIKSARVVKL